MKYLNDLEYSQSQSLYAGEPVQEIKALNQAMSNEYETTRKNKDALDSLAANLDVRDVDYGVKKQTIEGLRSQFEDLVKKGDYQNARFVVNDAIKKFNNDPLLKGAKNSKLAEVAYQKDLVDRLDKNQINQDQFNYGMINSKAKNQEALTYDPETGLYKNSYKGHDVFDDKSKDIYDDMDKRITGWKEGDIQDINGQRFKKIGGIAGGYINMETKEGVSKSEVQNALMTELSNRGDYKNFLDQERNIALSKLTGGKGVVTKEDLLKVIPEDELYYRLAGTSKNQLTQLEKSKDPKDKIELEKKLALVNEAKTKEITPEEAKTIFDTKYHVDQLNKYTEPAADKASFEKTTDKQWENKLLTMSLEHKYKMAEEDLKQQKATIGLSNESVKENFSPKELQNNYDQLKKANTDLEFLQQKYKGNLNPALMSGEDRNLYEKSKMSKTILEREMSHLKEDMKAKGVDMNQIVLRNAFMSDVEEVAKQTTTPLIDQVLKTSNVSEATKKELQEFKNDKIHDSSDGDRLFNILNKDKTAQKILNAYSDKIIELAKKEEDAPTGLGALNSKGGLTLYLQGVKIGLKEGEQKYFESKDLKRYSGQVLAIDDKDKNNVVSNEARQWNNLAQMGTEFTSTSNSTVAEIVEKYNTDNGFTGDKADKGIKLKDVQVQPIYEKINGEFRFQLRLPDGTLKQVTPKNQEDAQASLRRIANEYVKSPDPATANKGYEILGQVHNGDLSRINLNEFQSADAIPVALFTGKGEQMFTLQKNGTDNGGNPIFSLKKEDGSDVTFGGKTFDDVIKTGLGNPNGNNFSGLKDLATTLYLTGFNGQ